MRSHMIEFHKASAEHCARLAKAHAERSANALEHHDALPDGHEMCKYLKATADHHDTMAGLHQDHAVAHTQFAKALEGEPDTLPEVGREGHTNADSFGGRDFQAVWGNRLQQVRPDGVHGVVPDIPTGQLIPRPGGPEVNTDAADPVLRKLFE